MTIAANTESEDEENALPGEDGLWIFVFGDMLVFGIFFITYLYYRAFNTIQYNQSQETLRVELGVLNTLLLLTGSIFVVWALERAREGYPRLSKRYLLSAIACGSGFAVVKYFEYSEKIASGITVVTDEFFMFYFMYTGIHLVHVLLGLGMLIFIYLRVSRGEVEIKTFEVGAIFWHMVDLLWIMLFPLLYLVS